MSKQTVDFHFRHHISGYLPVWKVGHQFFYAELPSQVMHKYKTCKAQWGFLSIFSNPRKSKTLFITLFCDVKTVGGNKTSFWNNCRYISPAGQKECKWWPKEAQVSNAEI